MSCEHSHLDGAYVLGALSPGERQEFERHLLGCEECSRSVRELAGLPGLLALVEAEDLEVVVHAAVAAPGMARQVGVDGTARAYFQGLLKLTLIDTFCLALGLAAIGVPGAFALGLMAAVLAWVPFVGSVIGCARLERTGLLWIDAHGDFNTPETSPSGNIHGMPLAALCGLGPKRLVDLVRPGAKLRPEDVVLIGIRDLDEQEKRLMRAAGVTVYTMKEIDSRGLPQVAAEALQQVGGLSRVHVSFDADVLDPEIAPGVGTPVPGGLTYREAHLLMELLADSGRITSLDLVEVNPILDRSNLTANTLVGLTASLLGKKIY